MLALVARASYAAICPGDCDSNQVVDDGDLRRIIDLVFGVDRGCNGLGGRAAANDLIAAVRSAGAGCAAPTPTTTPGTPMPVVFTDVTAAAGVDYLQYTLTTPPSARQVDYLTGGAAAGDFDGDGWIDLYVTRLDGPGILFRNRGDGTFEDVTASAGLDGIALKTNGAVWTDIDNDGDQDLFVTTIDSSRSLLFINNGYGHFEEEGQLRDAAVQKPDPHFGFGVAAGDYDRDGYVDLYVTEWRPAALTPAQATSNARLLHNRGAAAPGFFEDVTETAGVAIGFSPPQLGAEVLAFGATFADLDNDGWPDLIVTGNPGSARLFWNDRDGTFSHDGAADVQQSGVGAAFGDFDGDGWIDWFVSRTYDPVHNCVGNGVACIGGGNALSHNLRNRHFADQAAIAEVLDGSWGTGAAAFDYDNDGDLDIVQATGVDFPFTGTEDAFNADPLRLWRNQGGDLPFDEVAAAAGLADRRPAKGVLVFDYDGDGDLDLFVVNNAGHPVLYRNDGGNQNGWLRVATVGRQTNADGLGARVTVTAAGGPPQLREIGSASHFLGAGERVAHFGLGSAPTASVRVDWPATGRVQTFDQVARNTTLVAVEPPRDDAPVFTDVTRAAGVWYTQQRPPIPDTCKDFHQGTLPFECWSGVIYGGAAAGDYDGDGFVDLYVTRLYDTPILFRNRGDGTFEDRTADAGLLLPIHANGAGWGDIDNDGDLDLLVTTIGEARNYLFINDGSGHFTEEAAARGAALEDDRPHWGMSVAFGDYDRDGWLDAYVSDWVLITDNNPPDFPSHARLLHNRGAAAPGSFEDVTVPAGVSIDNQNRIQPFSPAFVDLDGDGWQDLALVSDAHTTKLFWNDGDGTFSDGTAAAGVGLTGSEMGAAFADYDGDGDLDWFVTAISCQEPYDSGTTCTGNNLYRYDGNRTFSEQGDAAGVRVGHWGWGAAFLDYDNDGDPDLVMTNGEDVPVRGYEGHEHYHHDPMRFWRNDAGVFTQIAADVGLTDHGQGKGLLTFDYDNDGDLDLFVVNLGSPPRLYRNDGGNRNGWLRVRTLGHRSTREGYGARVSVTPVSGGPTQVQEIGVGSHFLGQSERTAHFGLGAASNAAEVRVTWPASGRTQLFTDVPRDTTVVAEEPTP